MMNHSIRWLLAFCVMVCSGSVCLAQSDTLEVVRIDGNAEIRDATGKVLPAPKVGARVPAGGSLSTGDNGRVVVRLSGNSGFAVLDRKSRIETERSRDRLGWLRHVSGWIYYALGRDANRKEPVQIQTAVATLGIRGTRFIVVIIPGRSELGMRKGQVSVLSPEGEFELSREDQEAEFDAYKRQGKEAVDREKEDFRKFEESTKKEFAEFTREFTVGAGRQASFDGKRVKEQALSAETLRDMEAAEFYAGEWLDTVKD